jgi:hypothetical protein
MFWLQFIGERRITLNTVLRSKDGIWMPKTQKIGWT